MEYLHGDELSMRKWIIIVVTAPLAYSGGIGGGSDAPVFVSLSAHQVQVLSDIFFIVIIYNASSARYIK